MSHHNTSTNALMVAKLVHEPKPIFDFTEEAFNQIQKAVENEEAILENQIMVNKGFKRKYNEKMAKEGEDKRIKKQTLKNKQSNEPPESYFFGPSTSLMKVREQNILYKEFLSKVLDMNYKQQPDEGFINLFDNNCFHNLFTNLFDRKQIIPRKKYFKPEIAGFGNTNWNPFGYQNSELELRKQILIHYCKQISYSPHLNRKEKKRLFKLVCNYSYKIDFNSNIISSQCEFDLGLKKIRNVIVYSGDRGDMIMNVLDDWLFWGNLFPSEF